MVVPVVVVEVEVVVCVVRSDGGSHGDACGGASNSDTLVVQC